MTRRFSPSLSFFLSLFVNVHARLLTNARVLLHSPQLAAIEHFSTPLAAHSRQRSGSSFRGSRDRPFILVHAPRPPTTSRSRSRARRSRVDPAAADSSSVNVVVLAIERLIRRGHRGYDDQPLPEKISLLTLPNIIFVGVSPPPLSADREPPPSPQSPNARPPRRFSVLLSFSLPLFLSAF